jgi:membrane protease YdiL (CAAX protease family)
MGKRIMGFYGRLFSQPPCVVFGLVFVAVKIWSNVAYGGSAFNGLRSGLVGLLVYGLALGVIYLLSDKPRLERFGISRLGKRENGVALLVMGALYLIMAAAIVDRLQRLGKMPGAPLLQVVPGWAGWYSYWESFPFGYTWANVLRSLPFQVLIPAALLWYLGLRRGDFAFRGGALKPALPFLIIYGAAFAAGGVSSQRLVFLLYALLYSGLQEEFFYRGVLQPLLIRTLNSPVWGMAVTTLLFTVIHLPDFMFRVYPSTALAVSSAVSAGMFGALMSYGVYRTGMLWPWMLIHGISNVVGF